MISSLDYQIKSIRFVVGNLDSMTYQRIISKKEMSYRSKAIMDLWALLKIKNSQIFQEAMNYYI